jgi:hypothetical protein
MFAEYAPAGDPLVPKSNCLQRGIHIGFIWAEETITYENNKSDFYIIP